MFAHELKQCQSILSLRNVLKPLTNQPEPKTHSIIEVPTIKKRKSTCAKVREASWKQQLKEEVNQMY
jgi:hypothetical protein